MKRKTNNEKKKKKKITPKENFQDFEFETKKIK